MIDSYQFGKIVIDGQEFTNDIMIHPDGRIEKWWRKEGHIVSLDDLQTLLNNSPKIMIIGAGCPGMLALPGNIITFLQEKGIQVVYDRTDRAIQRFNDRDQSQTTVAAFHLTC